MLNWNGYEDTCLCIDSILNSSFDKYTIVLVDNGSELEQLNRLNVYCQKKFKHIVNYNGNDVLMTEPLPIGQSLKKIKSNDKIVIIKNESNLGFAPGNNVALRFIKAIGGRYAMLLNNDTEVLEDSLSKMFEVMLNKKPATVIPQIRYFNPSDIIWNCGGKITWYGARRYYYFREHTSKVSKKEILQVDYATGCALMMDLDKTGLLSEKFFFGEEDFELSLRLKKAKLEQLCVLNSIILHKVGTSRKKVSSDKLGPICYHYAMRLSDLKDYQSLINWYITVFAHIASSYIVLRRDTSISPIKFLRFWKTTLKVVKRTDKFTREIFLNLTRKGI